MSDNSKIIATFVIGAAVGAAIGYFLASENKEEAMENIENTIDGLKSKLAGHIEKGRSMVNNVADKVEEMLNTKDEPSA